MMKLSVRSVVILIVLSLIGLVVVQTWLLSYAFDQKEQAFDRNARAALGAASRQLELGEITVMIQASIGDTLGAKDSLWSRRKIDVIGTDPTAAADSQQIAEWIRDDVGPDRKNDCIVGVIRSADSVKLTMPGPEALTGSIATETTFGSESYLPPGPDAGQYLTTRRYLVGSESSSYTLQVAIENDSMYSEHMVGTNPRMLLVRHLVDQLSLGESAPLTERLDTTVIDSIVRRNMIEAGIDLELVSGVHDLKSDSIVYATNSASTEQLRPSSIRARLFLSDLFASPYDLVAFFPNRTIHIWKQIGPQVAASVFLMIIIVSVFAYSARTIVRQRRFASRLTDFINNMTHEFKTPISTVALASEAIGRPDVASDQSRVSRYNQMIHNETIRMRKQTDKILQMAILEEGDYELKLEDVDLHSTIQGAVDSIALHVENSGGAIVCELSAKKSIVTADAVHVANIINNLLDNSIKYSPEAPNIRVRTMSADSGVTIEVTDRGVGIAPHDLKQVWQKYYRVSSGDRHDVKGFGLGLSYVRLMTEAHGGQVSLVSHPGEGTTVSVYLPTAGPQTSGDQK